MINYTLKIENLSKWFGNKIIFYKVSGEWNKPGIYGVAGPNGSGKSTLVKIVAGLNSQSAGKLEHIVDNSPVEPELWHNLTGFASPYIVLYDEFSALENIEFIFKIRGVKANYELANELLSHFSLYHRRKDPVKAYSSGMKQRLKIIAAVMHSPPLIILDEPTANLDNEGKDRVYEVVEKLSNDTIIFLATNEKHEIQMCEKTINILEHKRD
ncbi:MAG: ABC transporter ATP-binding protein [Ignavibacteriaceae bacterium]|nr:ABC transporter ATP-binding protein [Ignavibacteriaceae bacterium]